MDQHDVIKRTVELAETGLEALQHINNKLNAGQLEQTVVLMNDLADAFYSIEKAIQPLMPELLPNELEVLAERLRNAFNDIVFAYESGEINKVAEVMRLQLTPCYKKWQAEIDRVFIPYIIC